MPSFLIVFLGRCLHCPPEHQFGILLAARPRPARWRWCYNPLALVGHLALGITAKVSDRGSFWPPDHLERDAASELRY
jgi:hypothetical protein